jgi:Ni/Co efflux regulator RcnB
MLLKQPCRYLVIASMVLAATVSAMAERPEWAGRHGDGDRRDEPDRRGRQEHRDDDRRNGAVSIRIGGYFGERERAAVYAYYGLPPKAHCPPGLAKKHNGCQPPGQAKKWKLGQPLPRDLVYQPVEAEVRVRLGKPPAGHDFVRVAGDILLIAIGTSMVIDAIEDLQR